MPCPVFVLVSFDLLKLRLIIPGLLSLLFATGVFSQQAALVSVDPVTEQEFTQTVPVLGRLVAERTGSVASRISGAVDFVYFNLGDRLKKGQPLVSLDTATLKLRQKQAESLQAEAETRLKTARAQLALAGQEVKRLEELQGSAAVSKAAYDDARQQRNIAVARVSEAEASINSSQAAYELAELELSYALIETPFDGTITEKHVEVGNYVQQGETVAEMLSDSQLELEADVPASLLPGLTPGARVDVILENGSRHGAFLRAIIPEENPRTRTRRARFQTLLGDDAGILASEQSATVLVPASARRNVLTIHKDAVIRRGTESIVYVVTNDVDGESEGMVAEMRSITPGEAIGERIEVTAGVSSGERVVIRGNERLSPGQAVMVPPQQ